VARNDQYLVNGLDSSGIEQYAFSEGGFTAVNVSADAKITHGFQPIEI
jgi:hypothetical protein